MQITYRRTLPYPPDRIMAQYFDLKHLAHVHPRTFGPARLLSCEGQTVVWELNFPFAGLVLRNTVEQEYIAPDKVRMRIIAGVLRGLVVTTIMRGSGSTTDLEETYEVALPDFPPLRRVVSWWVHHWLDTVWAEDLRVGMPHGGWPGVPTADV